MGLEELILRYYLSLFSLFILIIYLLNILFLRPVFDKEEYLQIDKGETIYNISTILTKNNIFVERKLYYYILKFYNHFYSPINYGKFIIKKESTFLSVLNTISNKSNIDYKITIVEGWEKYQLNKYLIDFYGINNLISYENLLADTYIINSSNTLKDLFIFLNNSKNDFFKDYKENKILKKYGKKQIMIISSLVEKEAKNEEDKGIIASVILNRLAKKMKLQIDASVIYSITEGEFKLNRKLTYKDLKLIHPYNTYHIKGLPPGMISFVGHKTIKSVLELPKSDYLFYFYNIIEKKHIFSKNFKEHKKKLYDYRKKTK